jgi:23S rRNA (adenine2503-C2)-methyltransferase
MEAQKQTDDKRTNIRALSRAELEAFAKSLGEPAFRGRQIFRWMYHRNASSFDEMTDLPARFRERLAQVAEIVLIDEIERHTSDDGTVKSLFELSTGRKIEAVLIPDFNDEGAVSRLTVCVSSQVGCAMGCTFCATGLMGFQQNLTPGEIFDQVMIMNDIAEDRYERRITNIVFMGMGEPLLNFDSVVKSVEMISHDEGFGMAERRITISTVGLARRIRDLADTGLRTNLAVSLHAPTDHKRSAIMPVNRAAATDLTALRDSIQYYTNTTGRGVTYEYCMFAGVNDTDDDARALAGVVRWAPSKVNLIMYNPVQGLGFTRTPEKQFNRFIQILVDEGVRVTVRRSRGQDIDAACGQLAVREDARPGATIS